jgi:hypothetical protein
MRWWIYILAAIIIMLMIQTGQYIQCCTEACTGCYVCNFWEPVHLFGVGASFTVNGTLYYADLPQNDIYEKEVLPGDTIVLGRTYDLTKVAGVSKKFAWWSDKGVEGTTCTPDKIISISYIDTGGKISPDNVTLNSSEWIIGNWWQWDGCYMMKYSRDHPEPRYSVYTNDNNLMFHVIRDPHPPVPVLTHTPVPTPITTRPTTRPTITPVTTPAPVKDESWPLWYYPIVAVAGFILYRVFW